MWPSKASHSRVARVLGEVAFVLLVCGVASVITSLLVPLPFHVETGRTYTGEQAAQLGRVLDRRFWVGTFALIVSGLVLELARNAIRTRLHDTTTTEPPMQHHPSKTD